MRQVTPDNTVVMAVFPDLWQDTLFDFSQTGIIYSLPMVVNGDSQNQESAGTQPINIGKHQSLAGGFNQNALSFDTEYSHKAIFDTMMTPIEKIEYTQKEENTTALQMNEPDQGFNLFDLITGLMILFSFAYLRLRFYDQIKHLISAFFSNAPTFQMLREYNILTRSSTLIYSIVSVCSISWFAVLVNRLLHPFSGLLISHNWSLFAETFLMIICALTAKFTLIRFSSWLFKIDQPMTYYVLVHLIFLQMYGSVLFFLNVMLVWGGLSELKPVIWAGLMVGLALFALMFIRAFVTGIFRYRIAPLYIFMYLCILEILPLVVLYKLLMSEFS